MTKHPMMECREHLFLSIVINFPISFTAGNGFRMTDDLSCCNEQPNAFLNGWSPSKRIFCKVGKLQSLCSRRALAGQARDVVQTPWTSGDSPLVNGCSSSYHSVPDCLANLVANICTSRGCATEVLQRVTGRQGRGTDRLQ